MQCNRITILKRRNRRWLSHPVELTPLTPHKDRERDLTPKPQVSQETPPPRGRTHYTLPDFPKNLWGWFSALFSIFSLLSFSFPLTNPLRPTACLFIFFFFFPFQKEVLVSGTALNLPGKYPTTHPYITLPTSLALLAPGRCIECI